MKEQRQFWRNAQLGVSLMQATHVEYAYPRHSHDEYVICLVERGLQSFTMKGTTYVTPPNGLILINPGEVHTGEAAIPQGFRMRSLYPSTTHMRLAMSEFAGRRNVTPYFRDVRVDDMAAARSVFHLHEMLTRESDEMVCESAFLSTLALLIERYAECRPNARPLGDERNAIKQARRYIDTHYADRILLTDLAERVALSPYYLLRVFHKEVGLPPHAYLQNVRIWHAQRLIDEGMSLTDVAFEVGFSSQSHLTRCFKQFVGVTPGDYQSQVRSNSNASP